MSVRYIIGIDPANVQSAYCILDESLRPVAIAYQDNEIMYCSLVEKLAELATKHVEEGYDFRFAIEGLENHGERVGRETFETGYWIGRLLERLKDFDVTMILRSEEKRTICPGVRGANDKTIRHSLINRFDPEAKNNGKGTKAEPGWFYGFHDDIWQACAVAVTYHDNYLEGNA